MCYLANISKVAVAKEAVHQYNFDIHVIAHNGDIMEEKFGISFFSQFTVILNSLVNVDARKHINRLCLAANRPLINADSTGYSG